MPQQTLVAYEQIRTGTLPIVFLPQRPPAFPNALNDEFDDGFLSTGTKWKLWNPTGVAIRMFEDPVSNLLTVGVSGSNVAKTLFGIFQSIPSLPYSGSIMWNMGMSNQYISLSGTNVSAMIGLALFEDAAANPNTTDLYTFNQELHNSGTATNTRYFIDRWSNYNTRVSLYDVRSSAAMLEAIYQPRYFKVEGYFVSGSNTGLRNFLASNDGKTWFNLSNTALGAQHTLMFTPKEVGLVFSLPLPHYLWQANVDFIRFQNSGTFAPIYGDVWE
jgi:hypothetical protein